MYRRISVGEALNSLPSIEGKKALNLDLNFRVWNSVLTLWLVFGLFWLAKAFTDVNDYHKALAYIRMASSPLTSIKPESPDTIRRLSGNIGKLEKLGDFLTYHCLSIPVVWIGTIFIRRQFSRKTPLGPKLLLGVLCALLAFDIILALSTASIQPSEVRELIDVHKLRVIPFFRLLLIAAVLPFFTSCAPIYYQYVAVDKDVFSRAGAAWRFLAPREIAARITKLTSRRRRSRYAAWAFAVSAFLLALGLVLTKGDVSGSVGPLVYCSAPLVFTVVIWTLLEGLLLARALFSSSGLVLLLGGLPTCGILSVIVIVFLRREVLKELALAPKQNGIGELAEASTLP